MDLRVQNSVITLLGARPETVRTKAFVIGWDPTTDSRYVSYATPTTPEATVEDVRELVAAFRGIGRLPRLEYVPGYAPGLEQVLIEAGFTVEARHEYLVCLPETLAAPPLPAGVELLEPVTDDDRRDGSAVQSLAFGGDGMVTDDDVARIRRTQEKGCVVFIARDADGVCVAAGQASVPGAGLVEVAGIAGALVAAVVAEAFARGVEGAWLEAAGPEAWRVYERAGFKPTGQRLYIALEDSQV